MAAPSSPRLRTLVVEDEWPARNYLVELLESSGLAEVVGAVGGIEEARQALEGDTPGIGVEVAFVDVQLDGGPGAQTGLSLVRALNGSVHCPMFVLATAYDEHALEAFELGVVDYLLKPFNEERVVQCLRRLHQRRVVAVPHPGSGPWRIVARRKRSLVFLEPMEIWAFEAADRLTFVHTTHGTFDVDLSLAAVESSFGRAFLRVHRNWLVNAMHIKELERDGHETKLFVGAGVAEAGRGVRVPVARERAVAVREMLLTNSTGLRRQ
ncbi:MAG: LytTR family DNA-binding domain-containing protein [Myxococcota bacterium]|nr:LytTR family DNA-binding domain-containing protein [Myxococcota bacterium]